MVAYNPYSKPTGFKVLTRAAYPPADESKDSASKSAGVVLT